MVAQSTLKRRGSGDHFPEQKDAEVTARKHRPTRNREDMETSYIPRQLNPITHKSRPSSAQATDYSHADAVHQQTISHQRQPTADVLLSPSLGEKKHKGIKNNTGKCDENPYWERRSTAGVFHSSTLTKMTKAARNSSASISYPIGTTTINDQKSTLLIKQGRLHPGTRRSKSGEYISGKSLRDDDREHGLDSNDDDDDDEPVVMDACAIQKAQKHLRDTVGPMTYQDGGQCFPGNIDNRGITPYVTFTTARIPPSQSNNRLVTSSQPVSCGFCSSTNLVWILRCTFCGSARMSDAPRLKYLIDMVLSVEPLISAGDLAKRILDYASFDRVAMKVEAKFKLASLVRAKTAIMMMGRTIDLLRHQIVRMIFLAWKGSNVVSDQHEVTLSRLIDIRERQASREYKKLSFNVWKGYVTGIIEERAQRYALASKRNDLTKIRRVWGTWLKFMRIRAKKKAEQAKARYEAELNETPHEALKEIERLQGCIVEARRLAITATNTILDLLHLSLQKADHDVQKILELRQMYPSTAGAFFDSVHGQEILDALSTGHVPSLSDNFGVDDEHDDEVMRACLAQTKAKIDRMHSFESLIQWFNYQCCRDAQMRHTASPKSATYTSGTDTGTGDKVSIQDVSMKSRNKDKKADFKDIKGLQDLRGYISNPGVMLKLLCHTSTEANLEYQRMKAAESSASNSTSVITENSTTATTLSPSAQLQLKIYFKMVHRILNLPSDVINRESFVLNDFDSLYAYAAYLYVFHPNYVTPGLTLSPRYHLSYNFFTPQWEKVQNALMEKEYDPFAYQQFYIFMAKIKRVNRQFLRFGDICKGINQIAHWHQETVRKDSFNDLTRRVLGKDSNISVALEKETLAAFVNLPSSKLLPLCENENELKAIEQVFKDNVLDLIKIFRIYGSAAGGKGILEQEFLKIMTKAGVTDKKNILRTNLQIIYQQSRQVNGGIVTIPEGTSGNSNPVSSNSGESEDDPDDRGATPNEFFEALTRVAYHNFQKRREMFGAVSASSSVSGGRGSIATNVQSASVMSLLPFVEELVIERIVPLTKKFQEQGLTFKKQMIHPDVQYVCKAQEKKLKRIFTMYSQRNKNPGSRGKLMDLSDFESLLKDRRLVDALFPHGRIKQLVAFVQHDGEIATSASSINGYENDSEFVFSEFVEALGAIAVYRNANPYLPFAKKLESFFEENF